jgi:transcriptional regulator with XRE-family HTH domain
LPFCNLQIKALRSPHPDRWKCTQIIPMQPETIGDHLKRRRLQLHLMQAEIAKQLGVHVESVKNWERGAGTPKIRQIPKIVAFLGYEPEPEPEALPKRIAYARRRLGFTQEDLARALGVNPVTIYRWENSISVPPTAELQRLQELLRAK